MTDKQYEAQEWFYTEKELVEALTEVWKML